MTASPPLVGASAGDGRRFVCASAGSHRLAFRIAAVQEVLAPRAITRLFHTPPSLLGVVNLRGEILPVVDLALLVDGASGRSTGAAFAPEARLIVLRARVLAGDAQHRTAPEKAASLAVLVSQLDPLRDGDVMPLPVGVPDDVARLALGIVDTPSPAVVVIDPDKLVEIEELARMRI